MYRHTQEGNKEITLAKNLRLRSKLSLILRRRRGISCKVFDKQTETTAEETSTLKEDKWTQPRFVNTGKTFHGFSAIERNRLQKKSGTFCSLHQLLNLKSIQMSNSYKRESKQVCFDPIDIQLRRFEYYAIQEIHHKGSLSSDFSRDRRMAKSEMKERPFSDLDDRYPMFNGDIYVTPGLWLGLGAGAHASRYHSSMNTFSITSKTPSLPTITADESQEEEDSYSG